MTRLFGNAAQGFPALTGVLIGIALYSQDLYLRWIPVAALAVAFIATAGGKKLVGAKPILGGLLIETWILAAVSVLALSTMIVLWFTINASDLFLQTEESTRKVLGGALVGAVTSYLATLWTKDIHASEGPFWTGSQFRSAVQASFQDLTIAPQPDTREWDAVWEQRVRGGPAGWGFVARLKRSSILSDHVKQAANPAAQPDGEDAAG